MADKIALLAENKALRARIEELEATVREELCNCGPTDNPDLDEHADYCRARRALESDHGKRSMRPSNGRLPMGDHFEHVGYRYRPERTHFWRMVDPDDYESDEAYHDEMEHLADRGWQVERLYRRCEDGAG